MRVGTSQMIERTTGDTQWKKVATPDTRFYMEDYRRLRGLRNGDFQGFGIRKSTWFVLRTHLSYWCHRATFNYWERKDGRFIYYARTYRWQSGV